VEDIYAAALLLGGMLPLSQLAAVAASPAWVLVLRNGGGTIRDRSGCSLPLMDNSAGGRHNGAAMVGARMRV